MAGSRFASTLLSSGIALAAALPLMGVAPTAAGFDLASELLVYQETYTGEVSYPTTPEIDEILAGGLLGASDPGGGPGPTLTGTAAHASVFASGPEAEATFFTSSSFGSAPIGLRGVFSNLSLPEDAGGFAMLDSLFEATGGGARIFTYVYVRRNIGGSLSTGFFGLNETPGDGGITTSVEVELTAAETAALAAGASFMIDVIVDRDLAVATASLEISGLAPRQIGPLAIDASTAGNEFLGVAQALLHIDGDGEPIEIDLEGLEVYRLFSTSFQVDTLEDAVDAFPGDAMCATASGSCSLRAAIQESNATAGPGEVLLPSGQYVLTRTGAEEDAAATGDLDIRDDLVLRGAGRDTTRVDASGLDRVFDIPSAAADVRAHLIDVELTNGAAITAGSAFGGGVQSFARLSLLRCRISNNTAVRGGGIYNRGQLSVEACIVNDNEALDFGVGASGGGVTSASTSTGGGPHVMATIRDSAIVENVSPNIGGIEIGNAGLVRIENTTISGNSDRQIFIFNANVVLQHVTVVGASGPALEAGSFSGAHTLEFANSVFAGSPACNLVAHLPTITVRSGVNASSDSSCGFSDPGDIEDVPLELWPLAPLDASIAHLPRSGSPLIDSADAAFCLTTDQLETARPLDGDESGSAECDVGAIEAPEPGIGIGLATGIAGLIVRRRQSVRTVDSR